MRQRVKEAVTGLPVSDVSTVQVGNMHPKPATHTSLGGTPIARSAAGFDFTQVNVGDATPATIKPYWRRQS